MDAELNTGFARVWRFDLSDSIQTYLIAKQTTVDIQEHDSIFCSFVVVVVYLFSLVPCSCPPYSLKVEYSL